MSSNIVVANVIRFIFLVLLQGLVLQRIPNVMESYNQFEIFLYPIFIFLLPFKTPHPLLIALGFMVGISVDFFYDSPGVHASAGVFVAYIRPFVASILQPREGYNNNVDIPTVDRFGFSWFAAYTLILLFTHIFFYYAVEVFTFWYFWRIILNTITSFMISAVFIMLFQTLFNPKV